MAAAVPALGTLSAGPLRPFGKIHWCQALYIFSDFSLNFHLTFDVITLNISIKPSFMSISADNINEILSRLNRKMVYAEVKPLNVAVCGGTALIAVGLVARATEDVDIIALLRVNQVNVEVLADKNLPADVERLVAEIGIECVAPVSLRSGKNRAPARFRRFDVAGRENSASQPQPAAAMACS